MKKPFCAAVKACPVVVAVLVWVAGGAVDAQKSEDTRTLVVIGSAAVQGSNVTAARDAAIASSLMNAVAWPPSKSCRRRCSRKISRS